MSGGHWSYAIGDRGEQGTRQPGAGKPTSFAPESGIVRKQGDIQSEYTGPMKRTTFFLSLLFVLPACSFPQQESQSSWNAYQPRTLQSIIDAHQAGLAEFDSTVSDPGKAVFLTADSFPSRGNLVFLGKSRPLSEKRSLLVGYWQKMMGIKDDLPIAFGTEMEFKEGDREIWIAVQKPLLIGLIKEIQIGKPLTGYVMWMGAIKSADHWEWLFAMNEFDSPAEK
jgi:hypothetical protein